MKCPHCLTIAYIYGNRSELKKDKEGYWHCVYGMCPNCERLVIFLQRDSRDLPSRDEASQYSIVEILSEASQEMKLILVNPKGSQRTPCPLEVPENIAEDYNQACLVLSDSPKASAALSRRCLQSVLRDQDFDQYNLSQQIEEAMKLLPPQLARQVDAVRNIGNVAAHETKDIRTGEIVDVQPQEAEWNLDVLEDLFQHYYVLPATVEKKRAALNKRLQDAGEPPIK